MPLFVVFAKKNSGLRKNPSLRTVDDWAVDHDVGKVQFHFTSGDRAQHLFLGGQYARRVPRIPSHLRHLPEWRIVRVGVLRSGGDWSRRDDVALLEIRHHVDVVDGRRICVDGIGNPRDVVDALRHSGSDASVWM